MSSVKKLDKHRCEVCYDKKYTVKLDLSGVIITDICNECVPKLNLPAETILASKGKCKILNDQKLNPEQKTYFKSYVKDLSKSKDNETIVNAINSFIKERYKEQKKENSRLEILKNINGLKIVKQIDQSQFVAFHLFTRNQVFQIVSDENRAKKTRIDEFGKIIDISEDRTFLGWGGKLHFRISGPLLCDYDQSVFDALVKLWHEKQVNGIIFETNLSEIWRAMGNKSVLGSKNRLSLKRSFSRLYSVSIEVSSMDMKNNNFWGGGIVDNIIYNENPNRKSDNKVTVHLNLSMASNYLQGSYATLSHITYISLSSYAKKIYLYLMSHDHRERKIGLDKLRALIGVNENISDDHFIKYVNKSVKELKELKILEEQSKIERNIFISFVTKEAWDTRPINYELAETTEIIL